jgi:hypothetical protein
MYVMSRKKVGPVNHYEQMKQEIGKRVHCFLPPTKLTQNIPKILLKVILKHKQLNMFAYAGSLSKIKVYQYIEAGSHTIKYYSTPLIMSADVTNFFFVIIDV